MKNKKKISSRDGKLQIQIIRSDEPNDGRMLLKVNISFDNKDINWRLFDENWDYINYETKNLSISDEKEMFYYIPVEGKSKLIRKSDFKIFELKYQKLSTVRFIGNRFSKEYLIEIFKDEISITDLKKNTNLNYHPEIGEIIYNAEFIDDKNIRIYTYKIENGQRIESSVTKNIVFFAD